MNIDNTTKNPAAKPILVKFAPNEVSTLNDPSWRSLDAPVFVIELDSGRLPQAANFMQSVRAEKSAAQFVLVAHQDLELREVGLLIAAAPGSQLVMTKDEVDTAAAVARARASAPGVADAKTVVAEVESKAHKLTLLLECQHRALMAIHRAESVSDVETHMFRELRQVFELSWVRVFLHSPDFLDEQLDRIKDHCLYKRDLVSQSRTLGKIVFARGFSKAFSKREQEALLQISESVAFALDRLAKIDQAESLKQQWESTFDAISEPLCLTDENFNVLRSNKAFLAVAGVKAAQTAGMNCFAAFCGPQGPAVVKPLTSAPVAVSPQPGRFILERKLNQTGDVSEPPRQYEVTTQRILTGPLNPQILLILFRDVTEQKKIEKRIFESAKMAELGTIGSSIAHDINNPLGGMISFLQLIKMDLAAEHAMRADILEMEAAGLRCKEIVENLLRFSRRQEADAAEVIDLKEVVRQAIKIIELQTRSLGIKLEIVAPLGEVPFLGQFNLLAQALSQLLQNAYEAVMARMGRDSEARMRLDPGQRQRQNPDDAGRITVEIKVSERQLEIQITDNGIGISAEHQNKILNPLFVKPDQGPLDQTSAGLTLAYQIVDQHGGQLEIISQPNVGTTVKMTFINV